MYGILRGDVRDYVSAGELFRTFLNEETINLLKFTTDEDLAKKAIQFFQEKGADVTLSDIEGLYIGPEAYEFFTPAGWRYISENNVLSGENVHEEYKAIVGRKKN